MRVVANLLSVSSPVVLDPVLSKSRARDASRFQVDITFVPGEAACDNGMNDEAKKLMRGAVERHSMLYVLSGLRCWRMIIAYD